MNRSRPTVLLRRARRAVALHRPGWAVGLVVVLTVGLAVALPTPTRAAAAPADVPYTVVHKTFDASDFPGPGWATTGDWSAQCAPASPSGACSAVAKTSSTDYAQSRLSFTPTSQVPTNLQSVTMTFTESADFHGQPDRLQVWAVPPGGDGGDLNYLFDATQPQAGAPAVSSTPTTYTVPITQSLSFPLLFWWTSYGDPSGATRTWSISDITISGTLPNTAYALTANPIANNAYPRVTAGTPVTFTLSGSSEPVGDSLTFAITTPPTIGSFGPVTTLDATHAKVTYTTGATDCPDPAGTPGFLCSVQFAYTASDALGHTSAPATGSIDLHPGGAGGVPVTVTAPASMPYSTVIRGGSPVQAADLSGVVSVGPTGFPDAVEVHLRASVGTLDLHNADVSGVTYVNGTSNGGQQIQFRGPVAKINAALAQFVYLPPDGTAPAATVDVSAADLGPTGQSGFVNPVVRTIAITPVTTTPRPVLTLPTGPLQIANNGGPLTFPAGAATGVSLVDLGADSNTEDTVHLSVTAGRLLLPGRDTTGPSPLVTVVAQGGSFAVTGTVTQLATALADLSYDPTGVTDPSVTLSGFVSDPDSGLTSPTVSTTVTVIQAPSLYGPTTTGTLADVPVVVFLCSRGPAGAQLAFTVTGGPGHGTFVAAPSASVGSSGCTVNPGTLVSGYTYTPASGFTGADRVTYTVTDAVTGLAATGTVDITVRAHQVPVADDATVSTRQDTPVDVVVCALDTDPHPRPLTFGIASLAAHGAVTPDGVASLNTCGNPNQQAFRYTYTPGPGQFTSNGTDSFTYVVSNGVISRPATVTVTVATRTPHVVVQALSVAENGSLAFQVCATAPGGSPTVSVGQPLHGTLDTRTDATTSAPSCPAGSTGRKYQRYVPTPYFSGSDAVTVQVTDGAYSSTLVTLPITVTFVEVPPTVTDRTLVVLSGHTGSITLTGTSVHGTPLTFRVLDGPSHGTLSGKAPRLVYTPAIASGSDSFRYVANDGKADSAPATVFVQVAKPSLSSSACRPGAGTGPAACAGPLPTGPDGVGLAATDGTRSGRVTVRFQVTNNAVVADDVRITGGSTAPTSSNPWALQFVAASNDVTAAVTGTGLTVHLAPGASTVLLGIAMAPFDFQGASSLPFGIRAVSGLATSTSTAQNVLATDGAPTPTLTAAQADGSGAVAWPTVLYLSSYLYSGGPAQSARLIPSISGAGHNTYLVRAQAPVLPTGARLVVTRGSTDVTAAVLAGTLVEQCYSDIGCQPLTASVTPGTTAGTIDLPFTMTSTLDGRVAYAEVFGTVETTVGADLYSTPPRVGEGVIEATPVTQVVTVPVQAGRSATQRVILRSLGALPDSFSLRGVVSGRGTVSFTASSTDGSPDVDATATIGKGTYRVTLQPGQEVTVEVSVKAPATATAGVDAADVLLTAASALAPDHTDSYAVHFRAYSYQPDLTLTGPDGVVVGAGVFDAGNGSTESTFVATTTTPTTVTVAFREAGVGPQPTPDVLRVKAPASTSNFTLSYQLRVGTASMDVTGDVTGAGLTLSTTGDPTLVVSASSSPTVDAGRPGYFTVSASSLLTGDAVTSDAVQLQLLASGASQLLFGGLPQPEPADVTRFVRQYGLPRVAPFPSAGYTPGAFYGAYADPSGSKFAYGSTYDTYDLQIFAQNLTATRQSLRVTAPPTTSAAMPYWERLAFGVSYVNQGQPVLPADPLASDGVHPTITVGGVDVTAAVLAGTWSTDPMLAKQTLDIRVSFAPAAGDSRRYRPLQFALVDAATGAVSDQLHVALSSIITCSSAGYTQQRLDAGGNHLNIRSWDRANGGADCLQQLSNSYITRTPLVLTSDDTAGEASNADDPRGLWLLPQNGAVLRVDARTLEITAPSLKAYVDDVVPGADGKPDPASARLYDYLGSYTAFDWRVTDRTNGLAVTDQSVLARSPFPMVTPSQDAWPGNTMQARRYFQIDPVTGAPLLVGTMQVNEPWFHGGVDLDMPVDYVNGVVLDYAPPADTRVHLPGDDQTTSYGLYWVSHKDGSVTQGGCLGLPPQFVQLISSSLNYSKCIIAVSTTFAPISPDPGVENRISNITFGLIPVGFQIGTPEFNVQALGGSITLNPATGSVDKVVADVLFGVGPPTPCVAVENGDTALSTVKYVAANVVCPTNYFFYDAKVTFQKGGFTSANAKTGFGIKFEGTLSFLNLVSLNSVEADISTEPFNFHFANSPIDLSLGSGVPVSAKITLEGDVGALGFDIAMSGSVKFMGQTIASASGVLSTKGVGICGGLLGVSVGVGQPWDGPVQVYPSGCTTSQFQVTS